ncbi:glycosyltransferase family 2 protein [Arthrobacter sp. NPDC058127]|uniref:glycosyltransferase family 2 protein n=1 Tax=Arthrobacter sp. NPDC058127 TaxID=3346351 RepID=UPI0036ED398E
MTLSNVAAVVVHHRSYDTVGETTERLIAEGVEPSRIVVVDNSEEDHQREKVKSLLPDGVHVVFCSNHGYGAAVNFGVSWHTRNTGATEYLLVSTHEARPEPGAVRRLEAALGGDERIAVVGPALVTGDDSEIVWSLGGTLSRVLGLPRHLAHKASRTQLSDAKSGPVSWLDGAFLMFRRDVIEKRPIDEEYFLYMEETDHQLALRREGWRIFIEPTAVVWQSSGGVPPYYQTRNIQLFHAKNGTSIRRQISAPFIIARSIARDIIRRRGTSEWGQLISGWRAGIKLAEGRSAGEVTRVVIVNPLGGALAHYTDALAKTLEETGAAVETFSIEEPSVSGRSRFQWLVGYLRLLNAAARRQNAAPGSKMLVTWPVLGFLDLLLVGAICGKASAIVYHDPKPLVRAIGTGRAIATVVQKVSKLPEIIVHSQAAHESMLDFGFASRLQVLAHPMMRPANRNFGEDAGVVGRRKVRVLGQYKRDRDLDVLGVLARHLHTEFDLEIVGRGWPSVDGWDVDPRFVSESELDTLIETSAAIVIPYRRFYQSGIAIRALERGTPVVGRSETSLSSLYGADSELLVRDSSDGKDFDETSWPTAVRHAAGQGQSEVEKAANELFFATVSEWKSWIYPVVDSARGV